jgi:hypothetical protein
MPDPRVTTIRMPKTMKAEIVAIAHSRNISIADALREALDPLNRGRGRARRTLIADAVFTYARSEDRDIYIEQRFRAIHHRSAQ